MPVYNSIDNQLTSADVFGVYRRFISQLTTTATTAATTTSGYVTAQRYPTNVVMPSSFASGINGVYFTRIDMTNEDVSTTLLCGIEYLMGTLTVSGNTFSAGSAMPTKSLFGSSIQTASNIAFAVIDATLTATTPVLTITYTDQDGNTGNSAQLTLPTNSAVLSAFLIHPHLDTGDTGMREVTNISISTGSAGSITIYGMLPLQIKSSGVAGICTGAQPSSYPTPPWIVEASEKLAFYRLNGITSSQLYAVLAGVANYE